MSNELPWLSPEEISDLCEGLTQPAAQIRYLKRVLNITAARKPSGTVLVFRHQIEPKDAKSSRSSERVKPQPDRSMYLDREAYLSAIGKLRQVS
jgi:hypothetical protein